LFLRKSQNGDSNPNWKGGISPVNRRIRNGARFAEWRKAVFERDEYTCQECKARSGKGNPVVLHPHHIKAFTKYPKLRFDINNGITLCETCHRGHTARQVLKRKRQKVASKDRPSG